MTNFEMLKPILLADEIHFDEVLRAHELVTLLAVLKIFFLDLDEEEKADLNLI